MEDPSRDWKPQSSEMGQPLLSLSQDPPEYSSLAIPFSDSFPNTSAHPVQQNGLPAAPGLSRSHPGQTVVTVPPSVQVSYPAPLSHPLPDYLAYSIFTMLCCCLPLGTAALVYSVTTRDANWFGHQPIASRNSRMARILNHISVAIGLTCYVLLIVYIVFLIIALMKA